MQRPPVSSPVALGLFLFAGLCINVAWDLSALDLPLARTMAGTEGFPLRESWLLSVVLHEGARYVAWAFALALCVGVWWPRGALTRLELGRRLQLALTPLLVAMVPAMLKRFSSTSCPWDLHEFGGTAHLVSHWALGGGGDGGSGHCFPAGHAASGFAFVGGYFAFRHDEPTIARRWLVGALFAGFALGIAQQVRGAHFMSHTLWTAWLCVALSWVLDGIFGRAREWMPWMLERLAA